MPKITFTFDQETVDILNQTIIRGRLLPTGAEYEVDLWISLLCMVLFAFIYPALILCIFNLCGSFCRKEPRLKPPVIRYNSATIATPTCLTPKKFDRSSIRYGNFDNNRNYENFENSSALKYGNSPIHLCLKEDQDPGTF